ncbi:unnamed protein product [Bursaphelenchus xylophilus]|uniref:(pine wood nematode) hypothetical protein n=1 Tax=Bursaphelenchus xylophilus TaxID=6326 RepID=A0A1I7SDE0_BURXY|nr:unnamed protein product [Bursaphelenchus xylophilus]CAG9130627.1 unnamed protein product [Bursaphelenchus xylophilus]
MNNNYAGPKAHRRLSDPPKLPLELSKFLCKWNQVSVIEVIETPPKKTHDKVWIMNLLNKLKIRLCSISQCGREKRRNHDEDRFFEDDDRVRRRCFSTNAIRADMEVSIPECCKNRPKRVCFGIKQKNCIEDDDECRTPPCSPRPILMRRRNSITLGQLSQLPYAHMDYDTFKAWRRGSRLSEDVSHMDPVKPYKPLDYLRRSERKLKEKTTPIQKVVKTFVKGCHGPERPQYNTTGFAI